MEEHDKLKPKSEAGSRTLCNTLQIAPSVAHMICTTQMREHRPCRTGGVTGPQCICYYNKTKSAIAIGHLVFPFPTLYSKKTLQENQKIH
jgi:hypothetical protein